MRMNNWCSRLLLDLRSFEHMLREIMFQCFTTLDLFTLSIEETVCFFRCCCDLQTYASYDIFTWPFQEGNSSCLLRPIDNLYLPAEFILQDIWYANHIYCFFVQLIVTTSRSSKMQESEFYDIFCRFFRQGPCISILKIKRLNVFLCYFHDFIKHFKLIMFDSNSFYLLNKSIWGFGQLVLLSQNVNFLWIWWILFLKLMTSSAEKASIAF